jgi:ribose 5-phosphate isomerase A
MCESSLKHLDLFYSLIFIHQTTGNILMDTALLKKQAAETALQYISADSIIGVGTGSTVHYFIEALASVKHKIEGAVASSVETAQKLKSQGITVVDLNTVDNLAVYIDGADSVDKHLRLLKGGGGALTREKIIATAAKQFICIADERKFTNTLNNDRISLPIEVIPMARSYVAREIVKMKGTPVYRENFITDHHNIILDIYQLDLTDPVKLEEKLNNITGVVCHGLFAKRPADKLLVASLAGIEIREAL